MAESNKVKGWTGVLMTEDSSSHWPTKRRHVYYETSRRAGLEFGCVFGHDGRAYGAPRQPSTLPRVRGDPRVPAYGLEKTSYESLVLSWALFS